MREHVGTPAPLSLHQFRSWLQQHGWDVVREPDGRLIARRQVHRHIKTNVYEQRGSAWVITARNSKRIEEPTSL